MLQTHLFCFLASYCAALLLEVLRLWKSASWMRWASLGFSVAGVVAQGAYLLARSRATQLPPLLDSMHDWLLVSALLLMMAYIGYAIFRFRQPGYTSLGLFVLPLSLLMIGAASFVRASPNHMLETERFWKMLHASSLSIGITGVLIGFVFSLMYLLQHRRLKQKHVQRRFVLPPLSVLAHSNRWMVIVSVPMLTLGLVTGLILAFQAKQAAVPFAWADPLVIGFCVLWVAMFGLFVWLLRGQPAHGRQVAWLTVWACGFLIVTLVGLQVLVNVLDIPSQHGTRPRMDGVHYPPASERQANL